VLFILKLSRQNYNNNNMEKTETLKKKF
jgi:hypothetical protein